MRSEVQDSLLTAFRQEFQGDLAAIRREWEAYKPSRKTRVSHLPELRRILHTIKGSTRLLGFEGVPERVHALEEMVLEALRKRKKPEAFEDALADLEEEVARYAGLGEVSVELDSSETGSLSLGVAASAPGQTSPAYSFLLAADELLSLSLDLARALLEEGGGARAHQAVFLAERSRALREQARRLALVPSSDLFLGMTELARRTADDHGKTVRVVHHVEPDRLERDVVLGLRPALLHLVANAVIHGVPGSAGELTFGFRRDEAGLVVSVSDNGPGLDRQALGRAVVEGGHLSAEAWEELADGDQLQWLFHPGLSTRSEADLSSGRGMGLAVVAETSERLGGRVEVVSSARGTEFRLLVPANWNLRSVLRVRSGGRDFAVLSSELEAVQASALESAPGKHLGELVELLGYRDSVAVGAYRLLLRSRRDETVAVGVEHLGEFEEVLVTPLTGFTGLPQALVGVTPFQGLPTPVVSLRSLLEDPALPKPSSTAVRTVRTSGPLVLVVDDSLTTRSLVSGILQSSGYRVLAAADGKQGLELARTEGLAGIVSDLQMPILDGLGFLEKLREEPDTASIPFVLLTSIDDVATFEKASALGADRCLGKQNFSQELLLKTLEELL